MGTQSGDNSPVRAVCALPNGDVVVGRGFHTSGVPDEGLSRWNGSTWSSIGTILAHAFNAPPIVRVVAPRADGGLIVGGQFTGADGIVSQNLAGLASTCMPLAQPYGAGCNTAAGPLVIRAGTLPWLGAPFRTTTTGIAPGSLHFDVLGLAQLSTPLGLLHPLGQPGCSLLASADSVALRLPVGNRIQSEFALPSSPDLIGATFCEQTIALEFSLAGALVAIRGSNGLSATIGTL
jgi:hypothetical protein